MKGFADFLVEYRWGWLGAFVFCLILIVVGIYAQMRLKNPEYTKDCSWTAIDMAESNIVRYMCGDVLGAIVFFWLTALSFGIQLCRFIWGGA